jgi:hypothetical protein
MQTVCALAPRGGACRTAADTLDLGHGRMEPRGLQTRPGLAGSRQWPGLAHVLQLERQGIIHKPGAGREAVVAGVTSLAPARADAARWLALVRGQGHMEPLSHGGREVTCEAERSQGRGGHIPQGMAARRHTVSGLRRWAGDTTMAAACRRFAAQPKAALPLIGIVLEN